MTEKLKSFEADKENNYRTNGSNTNDNKELINKLKKLNRTLPLK